jgi:hypothetical protein
MKIAGGSRMALFVAFLFTKFSPDVTAANHPEIIDCFEIVGNATERQSNDAVLQRAPRRVAAKRATDKVLELNALLYFGSRQRVTEIVMSDQHT